MNKIKTLFAIFSLSVVIFSCKDEDEEPKTASSAIISSVSTNVIVATYNDLSTKAASLEASLITLNATTTQSNLEASRQLWKETRQAWEQSEGFLFGPVATEDVDPSIDTWPVNYSDMNHLLDTSAQITPEYLASINQDALRGFHPLEYMLWGQDGNKLASEFTARQKEYMVALGTYIKTRTAHVADRWNANNTDSYNHQFEKAGNGSTVYASRKDALLEVVNAMIGICGEVADGKIEEPFSAQDPTLEESPFSGNSITDFTNNMKSIQNVYTGTYSTDGVGVQDFVKDYNLSLDAEITQKIAAAITALGNVTLPFGQAIIAQPQQILAAQTAIRDLNTTLEGRLLPLIQQKVTD